jgi:hypothetical protein
VTEKAVELAAKAYAGALLSALLMFVVGYTEIRDTRSNRMAALGLQRDISILQSYAEATRSGLRAYTTLVSEEASMEDARIRTLIARIQDARATLSGLSTRLAATSGNLPDAGNSRPTRVGLNLAIRQLQTRLHFLELKFAEQDIGTLIAQPTLADLSIDVLARLGTAASANPALIVKSLAWTSSTKEAFDAVALVRIDRALAQLVEGSETGSLSTLRYSAGMLWDEWLKLKDDNKRIPSTRLRDQLSQASSKSLQAALDELLVSIDKSSEEAVENSKVSVKSLDITPTLKTVIIGYPYWVFLLLTVGAASLQTASLGDGGSADWPVTIITLRPTKWLAWPYRTLRFFAGLFPIAVGVVVGNEAALYAKDLVVASIYYGGLGLAAVTATAVVVALERADRMRRTSSVSSAIKAT